MKTITAYLPDKEAERKNTTLVQAWIPTELAEEIRKLKKQDHLNWSELLEACFKRYRDERKAQQ